jgi:hypothetical protein
MSSYVDCATKFKNYDKTREPVLHTTARPRRFGKVFSRGDPLGCELGRIRRTIEKTSSRKLNRPL